MTETFFPDFECDVDDLKLWAVVVSCGGPTHNVIEVSEDAADKHADMLAELKGRTAKVVPLGPLTGLAKNSPVPCTKPSIQGLPNREKIAALLSSELEPGFYWEYVREGGVSDSETLPRLVEVTCDDGITYIWVGEDRTDVLGYAFQNAFYIPAQRQMLDQIDFESAIARMPERKGFR